MVELAARSSRPRWSELDQRAKAMRIGHGVIGVFELGCLGYLWACALTRRRGRLLGATLLVLSAEGAGLVIGRGNCPLGPLQRRAGDPVPLFELVLPPRAAKAAVPVLVGVTLAGILTLFLRPPRTGRVALAQATGATAKPAFYTAGPARSPAVFAYAFASRPPS